MNFILLYILLALSILPTTVFFVSTSGSIIFYSLQFVLLLFQLLITYRLNNKIKLSIHWILFFLAVILSISGYIIHSENFNSSALYSFVSVLMLAINASLLFSISKSMRNETIYIFQKQFHILSIIFLGIGIAQYFGYLNFSVARAEYFTQSGTQLIQNTRSTSIFIEPSAWAIYYSMYLLFCYPRYKLFCVIVSVVSMILSYSTTGFIILFCVIFYIYFHSRYFWQLILLGIGFLFSILYYLESLDNDIINKIFFNSTDYRNVAPKIVLFKMFQNRPETIFFGNGIFSLMNFTDTLGLGEKGQTTQNLFVDITFEMGIFSLIILIFFVVKSINKNYKLLLIMLVFISQCGYRSYQFIFLLLLFNKISEIMYQSKSK